MKSLVNTWAMNPANPEITRTDRTWKA